MAEEKVLTADQDVVVTLDYQLEVEGKEIDAGPIQFLYGMAISSPVLKIRSRA